MDNNTALLARMWTRTHTDPLTGCWEWRGQLDRGGYGKINVGGRNGRTHQVHRLGATIFGFNLENDLTIDHLCRNPSCWNPAHLDPCTLRENILRGTGPTAQNARKTHCINGHALVPNNIRRRNGNRAHHRECLTCHKQRNRKERRE